MPTSSLDCLFIHPSALIDKPKYIIIPMGMIGLMNELTKRKISTRMINYGLELSINNNFSLIPIIKEMNPKVIALDLHWHEHSHSSIELAKICKETLPDSLIVLGGFTSSFFAEEIINSFDFIDVIVRGDADILFPDLVSNFLTTGKIIINERIITKKTERIGYKITPKTDDNFDTDSFLGLTGLDHWSLYLKTSIDKPQKAWFWYNYWLPVARGCNNKCSYCGGTKEAQYIVHHRNGLIFRSVDKVVEDFKKANQLGIHIINPSHDLELAGSNYWSSLFQQIRKEEIDLGIYLEIWRLPSVAFVRELSTTFNHNFTTLAITVLSGDEQVRKKNGKNFTNKELFNSLTVLDNYDVSYVLYFSSGLPFETTETIQKGYQLFEQIMEKYHPKSVVCTTLTLDPASPMYLHPKDYGIIPHFKNFDDYYQRTKDRSEGKHYDLLGYHTLYLDQQAILQQQQKWDELLKAYSRHFAANDSLTQNSNFI